MTRTVSRVYVSTRTKRWAEQRAIVWRCLDILGKDDKEIANRTALSLSTVKRLRAEEYSSAMQFQTMQKLCYAAGFVLQEDPITGDLSLGNVVVHK